MHRLTISLEDDDYEQVTRLANVEERSLNWVITKAVKDFLRERRLLEQRPLFEPNRREHQEPRGRDEEAH